MNLITDIVFVSFLSSLQDFLSGLAASPYLDMIKMLIGCVAWIGGLVLFVKWNEKRKAKQAEAA